MVPSMIFKRLLPPRRNVSGDARVVGLARDLVDLVDVDDAGLRPGDITSGLDQPEQDILDVFPHIAGLR